MNESTATAPRKWRYGIHPGAAGTQVRSLGRVELPLGEALRLEMVDADPGGEEIVHVQYYISTELGGWALWTSCTRTDLAAREAAFQAITTPANGSP